MSDSLDYEKSFLPYMATASSIPTHSALRESDVRDLIAKNEELHKRVVELNGENYAMYCLLVRYAIGKDEGALSAREMLESIDMSDRNWVGWRKHAQLEYGWEGE